MSNKTAQKKPGGACLPPGFVYFVNASPNVFYGLASRIYAAGTLMNCIGDARMTNANVSGIRAVRWGLDVTRPSINRMPIFRFENKVTIPDNVSYERLTCSIPSSSDSSSRSLL